MSVDLHLDEILMTSTRLGDLANVYKGIVGQLKDITAVETDLFEKDEPQAAYANAMNTLWDYCADTQNNLNGSATVLVRYINAVCAEDGSAAQDLQTQRNELDSALDQQEQQNGLPEGSLGTRPPAVDTNPDDGTVVDEPTYDAAEQPPEEN